MAKNRYGSKKRKSAKRAAAARKGWRTRKRRGTVGKTSRRSRRGGGMSHAARVRAGKKAWRARIRKAGSRKAAVAQLKRQLRRGRR